MSDPTPIERARQLRDEAEWQKHGWAVETSDLITEMIDAYEKAFTQSDQATDAETDRAAEMEQEFADELNNAAAQIKASADFIEAAVELLDPETVAQIVRRAERKKNERNGG